MVSLLRTSIGTLFLVVAAGPGLASPQESLGIEEASLDELIAGLPDLEDQWVDTSAGERVLRPPARELARRLEAGARLTDEQWVRALGNSGALKARPVWPVHAPYAVHVRVPAWLGLSQIRLFPSASPFNVARAGRLFPGCMAELWGAAEAESFQEIGYLSEGGHTLVFDVEVERGVEEDLFGNVVDDPLSGKTLWRGVWTNQVRVVPRHDQAFEVRRGWREDAAIRRRLGMTVVPWTDTEGKPTRRLALLVYSHPKEGPGLLGACALSLDLTLREHLRVLEREYLFVPSLSRPTAFGYRPGVSGVLVLDLDAEPFLEEGSSVAEVTLLSVEGIMDGVLRAWDAAACWRGDLEISVSELLARERRRSGSLDVWPWSDSGR